MSPALANIVGLIGSAIFIAAFAYANIAKEMNKILFNALNLVGALLLIGSLLVHWNLAAFVLEVCWALIAFGGLVAAMRKAPDGQR